MIGLGKENLAAWLVSVPVHLDLERVAWHRLKPNSRTWRQTCSSTCLRWRLRKWRNPGIRKVLKVKLATGSLFFTSLLTITKKKNRTPHSCQIQAISQCKNFWKTQIKGKLEIMCLWNLVYSKQHSMLLFFSLVNTSFCYEHSLVLTFGFTYIYPKVG